MNYNNTNAAVGLLLLSIVTAYLVFIRNKIGRFMHLLSRKGYIMEIAAIVLWSVAILRFDGLNMFDKSSSTLKQLKKATTHGITAFIIATLAYIGLTTPTFWLVVLITYYIDTPLTGVY